MWFPLESRFGRLRGVEVGVPSSLVQLRLETTTLSPIFSNRLLPFQRAFQSLSTEIAWNDRETGVTTVADCTFSAHGLEVSTHVDAYPRSAWKMLLDISSHDVILPGMSTTLTVSNEGFEGLNSNFDYGGDLAKLSVGASMGYEEEDLVSEFVSSVEKSVGDIDLSAGFSMKRWGDDFSSYTNEILIGSTYKDSAFFGIRYSKTSDNANTAGVGCCSGLHPCQSHCHERANPTHRFSGVGLPHSDEEEDFPFDVSSASHTHGSSEESLSDMTDQIVFDTRFALSDQTILGGLFVHAWDSRRFSLPKNYFCAALASSIPGMNSYHAQGKIEVSFPWNVELVLTAVPLKNLSITIGGSFCLHGSSSPVIGCSLDYVFEDESDEV